jgi:hypothetical protein
MPSREAGIAALGEIYTELRSRLLRKYPDGLHKRLWITLYDDYRLYPNLSAYHIVRARSSESASPVLTEWPPQRIEWRRRDRDAKPAERQIDVFADYHNELAKVHDDSDEANERGWKAICGRWGIADSELRTLALECNVWFGGPLE